MSVTATAEPGGRPVAVDGEPAGTRPGASRPHAEFMQIWEEGYVTNSIAFEAMHTQLVFIVESEALRLPDGALDRDRIQGFIERTTAGVGMFRLRLMRGVLGLTPPAWVPDESFDIRRHVQFADEPSSLSSATLPELSSWSAGPMPIDHPLWRFRITELDDGTIAVGAVFHHAVADGLSAMKIISDITDNSPEPRDRPADGILAGSRAPHGPASLPLIALAQWRERYPSAAVAWREYWSKPLHRRVRRVGGRLLRPLRDARLARSSVRARELPPRHSDFATVDSAIVAQRAAKLGGTISDLLLAAAMRASRGDPQVWMRTPVSERAGPTDRARNRVRDIPIYGSAEGSVPELMNSIRTQIESRGSAVPAPGQAAARMIGYVTVLPWRSRPRYFCGGRIRLLVPFPASLPHDELSAGGVLYDGRLTVTVTMQASSDVAETVRRVAADLVGAP